MIETTSLLAGLYCAVMGTGYQPDVPPSAAFFPEWFSPHWLRDGIDSMHEQTVCTALFSDQRLRNRLAQAFERAAALTQQIPRICIHAHINPERATRFMSTVSRFTLVYIPYADLRGCIYALHEHRIAGYIRFGHETTRYHIFLLKVLPAYRNQGLGSALLLSAYATIAASAREQGKAQATIYWEAITQEHDHGLPQDQLIHFYCAHGAQFEDKPPDEFNSMTITIPT